MDLATVRGAWTRPLRNRTVSTHAGGDGARAADGSVPGAEDAPGGAERR